MLTLSENLNPFLSNIKAAKIKYVNDTMEKTIKNNLEVNESK